MPVRQEAPMTTTLKALREKRALITARLAQIDDLRPGFLTARFRKCGKPNCHCAQKDSRGHGPSYSLTHRFGGKTVTQVIPQGPAVERAKAQIAEYRRFRNMVRELIAVSEQICSAQLRDPEAIPATEAKKKTSSPIYWPSTSFKRLRPWWGAKRSPTWISRLWKSRFDSRCCNWQARLWSSASTLTFPMKSVGFVVLAGVQRVMPGVAPSRSRVYSVRCDWSAPIITAPYAATATVLGINSWA